MDHFPTCVNPISVADHARIWEAVNTWPQPWRDLLEERFAIMAERYDALQPLGGLREAMIDTMWAARWEVVELRSVRPWNE